LDVVAVIGVLAAAGGAAWVLGGPLRTGRYEAAVGAHAAQLADLEAAKAARYREIREAEMDYRTGKLSEEDWRAIDRQLRAEAIEVLRKLDALGAQERAEADAARAATEAEHAPGAPRAPDAPDAPAAEPASADRR
jgi:hypothetical protein